MAASKGNTQIMELLIAANSKLTLQDRVSPELNILEAFTMYIDKGLRGPHDILHITRDLLLSNSLVC